MNIWILTRTFAHGVWHVPASRLTAPTSKERTAEYIQRQEVEASKLFIVIAFMPATPFCHHELTTTLLKIACL